MDGGLFTAVGGASGAGELALYLLPGEGDGPGRLGDGALYLGGAALGVLGSHPGGFPCLNQGIEFDRLLPVLPTLVGGAGLGVQLPRLLLLLAGAEHIGALPA